ncbi:hypothetical protein NUW54_g4366 [Trametes sanguinea]|uniref:Uncharacterized protein n=1 Tax=Trametes sanguinea TaxID=158606 RepID=A0ACC1Q1Q0_9APHY|nr:hypothetical protein NUW54_g4366 [Trametes sanguinea]
MAPSLSGNAAAVLAEPSPGVPGTLSALTESLGAILLGTIFGSMLYGLMLHQTYRYWRLYPNDKFILKGLVASIVVMETFHMVLWIIVCYEFLIVDYLNPLKIVSHQPWFLVLTIPMVVVAAAISQAFYAGRLYYIGPQYRPLVFVAVSVMLMATGWGFAATVQAARAKSMLQFLQSSWILCVSSGHVVLCDLITTSSLVYVLWRRRTGVKRTDSVVSVLIVYTINTGLVTTVFTFLIFLFALVRPNDLIYGGISIFGVKLYSNSTLAVLNSRRSLAARLISEEPESETGDFQSMSPERRTQMRNPHTALETWSVRQREVNVSLPIAIEVSTTTITDAEDVIKNEEGQELKIPQRAARGIEQTLNRMQ